MIKVLLEKFWQAYAEDLKHLIMRNYQLLITINY